MRISLNIKAGFTLDARLVLSTLDRNGKIVQYTKLCEKLSTDNHFNDRYYMNLTPADYDFVVNVPDDSQVLIEQSYVEFGFTGSRYLWVGPGLVKTVPLNQMIDSSEIRKI